MGREKEAFCGVDHTSDRSSTVRLHHPGWFSIRTLFLNRLPRVSQSDRESRKFTIFIALWWKHLRHRKTMRGTASSQAIWEYFERHEVRVANWDTSVDHPEAAKTTESNKSQKDNPESVLLWSTPDPCHFSALSWAMIAHGEYTLLQY